MSCTTGFEAAVMEKPAVSFVPSEGFLSRNIISNLVNPVAVSISDVLGFVEDAINRSSALMGEQDWGGRASGAVFNASKNESSVRKIVEFIEDRFSFSGSTNVGSLVDVPRNDYFKYKFSISGKDFMARLKLVASSDGVKLKGASVSQVCDSLFFAVPK
jgi:hypothetical protein